MIVSKAEIKNLMNMKVTDLKAELKKRGFKGYSKMKKSELQDALLDLLEEELKERESKEIAELKGASKFIRKELSERVDVRHTPELEFVYDESIEYAKNIENIIEKIHIDKECK